MSLADLSIKRPIFISCVVILMLAVGYLSLKRLPVDLFPNVTFPVVMVNVPYPGAGPKEVETLVSKPLEEEMSTLPGIKALRSVNQEGISQVIAEFTLETDIKYAEQQIRDKLSAAKRKLPTDIKEPVIRRMDPADQPILVIAVQADLTKAQLFDLADEVLKPKIEQINQVGLVDIIGGRKREVHVELDREKLKAREISATQVANRIAASGQDVPAGKFDNLQSETIYRTLGEFKSLKDIGNTIVNFKGNDVPVTVSSLGKVVDSLENEKSRAYFNGRPSLFLMVFRQTGSNTVAVVDSVKKRMEKLNDELKALPGKPTLSMVQDGSKRIRANIYDVNESIIIGIILTVLVVFVFLRSARSTLITALALPNSLLGAFLLMAVAGFTVNIMTLLALSLAVGLLIDDAIVVRENIFRHQELGKGPVEAAIEGTKEVSLAVIATTFTVIAVFGPIAFLKGVVGQFFREFGLTVCFAMLISLFDALTIAPMLSAYLAKQHGHGSSRKKNPISRMMDFFLDAFDRGQTWLENLYVKVIKITLRVPLLVIGAAIAIFIGSIMLLKWVPKTFLPPQDSGEVSVSLELPPGTSLTVMAETALKVDEVVRGNAEVKDSVLTIGNEQGQGNVASFFIQLVDGKLRKINTSQFKEKIRGQLKAYANARPIVKDPGNGGGDRPFTMNIVGGDLAELEKVSMDVFNRLKDNPGLKDVDMSYRPGKPEVQVVLDNRKAELLGVSSIALGQELRTQIEGSVPAVFRENGREYDIRVRTQDDQRNLEANFERIDVPNVNNTLIHLKEVAKPIRTVGPANITRQDRGRYIQISADIAPEGPGLGATVADIKKMFETEVKLPSGMRYAFVGQAENFQELMGNMLIAMGLGVLFIYLVLASLYESFVTPFTIMLVLPLAACGAFAGLFVTRASLDLFSMIGCVMLLGIATKNSILLVDYTMQLIGEGKSRAEAITEAGKTRLRPILMTTIALIAGMLPVAIGLNEASKQRTSMGIAIIGGLISSTLLTLVVIPAAFSYIDRFRLWSGSLIQRVVQGRKTEVSRPSEAVQ